MAKPFTSPDIRLNPTPAKLSLKSVEFMTNARVDNSLVERVDSTKYEDLCLQGGFILFGVYLVPISNVKSCVRA